MNPALFKVYSRKPDPEPSKEATDVLSKLGQHNAATASELHRKKKLEQIGKLKLKRSKQEVQRSQQDLIERQQRQLDEMRDKKEEKDSITDHLNSVKQAILSEFDEERSVGMLRKPPTLPEWAVKIAKLKDAVVANNKLPAKSERAKLTQEALVQEIMQLVEMPPGVEFFDFQYLGLPFVFTSLMEGKNAVGVMPTGSGKTYLTGYLIWFMTKYKLYDTTKPVLVVTKPTVVVQMHRVLLKAFKLRNLMVTSYAQLRSSLGSMFILESTKMVEGVAETVYEWDPMCKPDLAIFDESQSLKNEKSTQTKLVKAFTQPITLSDEQDNERIIQPMPWAFFLSATPYSKALHTKYVFMGIRPTLSNGRAIKYEEPVNKYIREVCARYGVQKEKWDIRVIKDVQRDLEPYTWRFGRVKYKHTTIIKQVFMNFETQEEKTEYENAELEFAQQLQELYDQKDKGQAVPEIHFLVAMKKFEEKSEIIRAPRSAEHAVKEMLAGRSPIIACKYRTTLEIIKEIILEAGLPENLIAEIKGGQTVKARQANIDNFQADRAHIMLLMFSAGGAGLSLHHHKPKNKRQRVVILPPVWNSEELVQVLGRAHRVNSESCTRQYILWYAGTVEQDVAAAVKKKCASLTEVTGKNEDWAKDILKIPQRYEDSDLFKTPSRYDDREDDDDDDHETYEGLEVETEDDIILEPSSKLDNLVQQL